MIRFDVGRARFNLRVAGVCLHDGQVLLHRAVEDDFWALPGGRPELLEDAASALRREMREATASAEDAITWHLTPAAVWEEQVEESSYLPEAYDADGFIHCTDGVDRLLTVGNTFYQEDPRPYLAVKIAVQRLTAPVRYDDPERVYPHIYGPLNRSAVESVWFVRRAADGTFIGIN